MVLWREQYTRDSDEVSFIPQSKTSKKEFNEFTILFNFF